VETRPPITQRPFRDDGAYVFHHPAKFMWNDAPIGRQSWGVFSAYLHVPFCREICNFCTFERSRIRKGAIAEFIQALAAEMDLLGESDDFTIARIESVYLGGGTASLMPNDAVAEFLVRLRDCFGLLDSVETTIECEPGTKREQDFVELRQGGVNRVSVGVQTFSEHLLPLLNRIHKVNHSLAMIEEIRAAGIENVHIDLMLGLPAQTIKDWEESIDRAIALRVEHISTYKLITFKSQLLDRTFRGGGLPDPPPPDQIEEMYRYSANALTGAGYERYSLTEYCKPGRRSRYVSATWDGSDYLGMGPGAYSRCGFSLWENSPLQGQYRALVAARTRPTWRGTRMEPKQVLARDIAMGLCLLKVDLRALEERTGLLAEEIFGAEIRQLTEDGLLTYDQDVLALTGDGIQYATHVMHTFTQ